MPERHDPSEVRTSSPDIILAELTKAPEEMDTDLIDKAVGRLPKEEDAGPLITSVHLRYAKAKRKQRYQRLSRRVGVAAAAIVLLFGGMIGAARAFNWYGLLRFFAPVAGVMLWSTPDDGRRNQPLSQEPTNEPDGAVSDFESVEMNFANLQEVLAEVASPRDRKGIEALSGLHAFQAGHLFRDAMGAALTLTFSTDHSLFFVSLTTMDESIKDAFITDLAVEQVDGTDKYTFSDGVVLVIVENNDSINGQWATEDGVYAVWGNMQEQEMLDIIKVMREGTP